MITFTIKLCTCPYCNKELNVSYSCSDQKKAIQNAIILGSALHLKGCRGDKERKTAYITIACQDKNITTYEGAQILV